MSTQKNVSPIAYVTLAASIILGISGQLLMKYTMTLAPGNFANISFIQLLFLSLTVYSLGVINWILTLKSIKLSIAYPLTSLNYVGILLGSYYFFNEEITITRIIGVLFVFIGVLLVAIPIKFRKISDAETI